jgi:hypothetical protein
MILRAARVIAAIPAREPDIWAVTKPFNIIISGGDYKSPPIIIILNLES